MSLDHADHSFSKYECEHKSGKRLQEKRKNEKFSLDQLHENDILSTVKQLD